MIDVFVICYSGFLPLHNLSMNPSVDSDINPRYLDWFQRLNINTLHKISVTTLLHDIEVQHMVMKCVLHRSVGLGPALP
jgi:hypothetical protein